MRHFQNNSSSPKFLGTYLSSGDLSDMLKILKQKFSFSFGSDIPFIFLEMAEPVAAVCRSHLETSRCSYFDYRHMEIYVHQMFGVKSGAFQDGAQFAKWRCVHKIGATTPSHMALVEIAEVWLHLFVHVHKCYIYLLIMNIEEKRGGL